MHCEGCGYCYEICPKEAIILNPGHTGYLKVSETRFGSTLVHASLNIGAENSGKLVSRVREKLNQIADDSNANLIITDGSPGIGCPVIATITGASHILIVTEPGMSALHDMERLIKLAQAFKISVSCIINKYDIENDLTKNIEEYLKQNNIPLWGKLPYNDVFRIAVSDLKTAPELNHELINKEFKKIVEFVKNTLL
jgi:MinD superfamily P-loop ATPase